MVGFNGEREQERERARERESKSARAVGMRWTLGSI